MPPAVGRASVLPARLQRYAQSAAADEQVVKSGAQNARPPGSKFRIHELIALGLPKTDDTEVVPPRYFAPALKASSICFSLSARGDN